MNPYSEAPTRLRKTGAADKVALMEAAAEQAADDRQFAERVLYEVRNAGNDASEQAAEWAKYCEGLPYRREQQEVYRAANEVVGIGSDKPLGGDCDDIVVVFVAGCLSLGIPAKVQILCDDQGWGFHVRAMVGLPPHSPTHWQVVDPVWKSEKEWAMVGKDPRHSALTAATSPYPSPAPLSYSEDAI